MFGATGARNHVDRVRRMMGSQLDIGLQMEKEAELPGPLGLGRPLPIEWTRWRNWRQGRQVGEVS